MTPSLSTVQRYDEPGVVLQEPAKGFAASVTPVWPAMRG